MKQRIEWWSTDVSGMGEPIDVDVEAGSRAEAHTRLSAALTKLVADAEPDVCHPGAACSKPETRSKPTPDLFCPTCPDVERAHATMLANLTDVQKRCTELVEELRVERAKSSGPALTGPMRLVSSAIHRSIHAEDSQTLHFAHSGVRVVVQAEGVLVESDAVFESTGKTFVLAPEHQDITAIRSRAKTAEAEATAARTELQRLAMELREAHEDRSAQAARLVDAEEKAERLSHQKREKTDHSGCQREVQRMKEAYKVATEHNGKRAFEALQSERNQTSTWMGIVQQTAMVAACATGDLPNSVRALRGRADSYQNRAVVAETALLEVAEALGVVHAADGHAPQPGPASAMVAEIRALQAARDRANSLADERSELRIELQGERKKRERADLEREAALSPVGGWFVARKNAEHGGTDWWPKAGRESYGPENARVFASVGEATLARDKASNVDWRNTGVVIYLGGHERAEIERSEARSTLEEVNHALRSLARFAPTGSYGHRGFAEAVTDGALKKIAELEAQVTRLSAFGETHYRSQEEYRAMLANLTATQERCTALETEVRAYRPRAVQAERNVALFAQTRERCGPHGLGVFFDGSLLRLSEEATMAVNAEREFIAQKLMHVCGPWSEWIRKRLEIDVFPGQPDLAESSIREDGAKVIVSVPSRSYQFPDADGKASGS